MERTVDALLAEVPDLPVHQTRRLVELASGLGPAGLVKNPTLDEGAAGRFRGFVDRRRRGEPLQYIEGTAAFGPLELIADRRALIPRPETERLWELAVAAMASIDAPTIVDLCTGSGNLALALKYRLPDAAVTGVDLSSEAISLARENATRVQLDVDFRCGDLFAALPGQLRGAVDLVVSNPPYVTAADYRELPSEIRDFEPMAALVAGPAGTEVLAAIAAGVGTWLGPGGAIVCEIGEKQGDDCLALFSRFSPRIERDLADRPRFILGSAPDPPNVH